MKAPICEVARCKADPIALRCGNEATHVASPTYAEDFYTCEEHLGDAVLSGFAVERLDERAP